MRLLRCITVPELPEVETIRRQLVPLVEGRKCVEATSHWSEKFLPAREVTGVRFKTLTRKGKYLICGLDDDGHDGEREHSEGQHSERELIVHLGMTGSLLVVGGAEGSSQEGRGAVAVDSVSVKASGVTGRDKSGKAGGASSRKATASQIAVPTRIYEQPSEAQPHKAEHIRARWWLDDGSQLIFNDIRRFGRLRVVPAGCYETAPTLAAQGPDALSKGFTPEVLHARLRQSRRTLKTQLLSQRPVAGLGNIYADEALWESGIHPARRNLSPARCETLHQAIKEVLNRALKFGGTTLRDYRTPDASTGSFQKKLRCYGRAGHPCPRCQTPLRKQVIDARTTTWCPRCQR